MERQPSNLRRWNGTTWSDLVIGARGTINALSMQPNGELLVAGDFVAPGTSI